LFYRVILKRENKNKNGIFQSENQKKDKIDFEN